MEIICKIYLSNYLSYFSTFLLRIANPYTQWVWIANPDQRHDMEHPLGRVGRNEHPRGRDIRQIGTSVRSGKSGFLLLHALFWFSTLLFRIENPYTQWVWIANPDQRYGMEHPLGREYYLGILFRH